MIKICLLFCIFIGTTVGIPIFFPAISRPIINGQKKMEIPTDDCGICNYIVTHAQERITNQTLESIAFRIMKNTCGNLPRKKQPQCIEMVRKNSKRMTRMISKKEDSNIICSEMHICNDPQKNQNITDCNFCKYASVRIEGFLNKNHTLFDLINFAENFCDDVSENYFNTCTRLMEIHYLDLIAKLMDRNNAIDACEAVKLCLGGSALPP